MGFGQIPKAEPARLGMGSEANGEQTPGPLASAATGWDSPFVEMGTRKKQQLGTKVQVSSMRAACRPASWTMEEAVAHGRCGVGKGAQAVSRGDELTQERWDPGSPEKRHFRGEAPTM